VQLELEVEVERTSRSMAFLADIITMENPVPYCVWVFGGHSRERYNAAPGDSLMAKMPYLPSNHQPNFVPDPEPTLRTGVYPNFRSASILPATGSVQKTA
jgi:hypothetical protein